MNPVEWKLQDILQSLHKRQVKVHETFALNDRELLIRVKGEFNYQPPGSIGHCSVGGMLWFYHEDIESVTFGRPDEELPQINLKREQR